MKQSPS